MPKKKNTRKSRKVIMSEQNNTLHVSPQNIFASMTDLPEGENPNRHNNWGFLRFSNVTQEEINALPKWEPLRHTDASPEIPRYVVPKRSNKKTRKVKSEKNK
jgi:hypothetical protein